MPDKTIGAFTDIFTEAMGLFARKNADYGDTWRKLGIKGVFVRWSDKQARLETLLWDSKEAQVQDESIRDTLRDALVYNLMMLYLWDEYAKGPAPLVDGPSVVSKVIAELTTVPRFTDWWGSLSDVMKDDVRSHLTGIVEGRNA